MDIIKAVRLNDAALRAVAGGHVLWTNIHVIPGTGIHKDVQGGKSPGCVKGRDNALQGLSNFGRAVRNLFCRGLWPRIRAQAAEWGRAKGV